MDGWINTVSFQSCTGILLSQEKEGRPDTHRTMWLILENMMLPERRQTQKDT